ncbi:hypothetical protein ACB371_05220 [Klebsiella pneumoniae]
MVADGQTTDNDWDAQSSSDLNVRQAFVESWAICRPSKARSKARPWWAGETL